MFGAKPPRSGWFTAEDLAAGELRGAVYLVLFGRVFDLQERVARGVPGRAVRFWRELIGQSVDRFFNSRTGCPAQCHPLLALETRSPTQAELGLAAAGESPWWAEEGLRAGRLSSGEIDVRIVNTLTFEEQRLRVPGEESLAEIADRYLFFNAHALSYTWKDVEGRKLDMAGTLGDNGLLAGLAEEAGLLLPAEERLQPLLLLHFNDDLTEC